MPIKRKTQDKKLIDKETHNRQEMYLLIIYGSNHNPSQQRKSSKHVIGYIRNSNYTNKEKKIRNIRKKQAKINQY